MPFNEIKKCGLTTIFSLLLYHAGYSQVSVTGNEERIILKDFRFSQLWRVATLLAQAREHHTDFQDQAAGLGPLMP